LSELVRSGFLQSYNYRIQDLRQGKWSRETIPYEFFKDGAWIYDHQAHIKNLRDIIEGLSYDLATNLQPMHDGTHNAMHHNVSQKKQP